MARLNKKVLLILVVVFVAMGLVAATGAFYFLNRERRQQVLLDSAREYMKAEDYESAVLKYKSAFEFGNLTAQMHLEYGECLEALNRPQQAREQFENAAAKDSTMVEAHRRILPDAYRRVEADLGRSRTPADMRAILEGNDYRNVKHWAEELKQHDPTSADGYLWLARAHALAAEIEEEAYDQAEAVLEEGLANMTDEKVRQDLNAERIVLLTTPRALTAEEGAEAVTEEEEAARRREDAAQRLEQARTMADDLIEAHPEVAAYHFAAARVHVAAAAMYEQSERTAEKEEALDQAEAALKECLRLDEKHKEARRQIARLYASRQRYDDAEEEWQKLADLDRTDTGPLRHLAELHLVQNDREAALESLGAARERDPNDMATGVFVAQLQIESGRFDDATETIAELGKLGLPSHWTLWLEGYEALQKGHTAAARTKLEQALRKAPSEFGFAGARYALGRCHMQEGNYGAAEEQLRRASASLERYGRMAELALVELNLAAGKPQDALTQCAEIEAKYGAPPLLVTLGRSRAQQQLGQFAEAEETLKQTLSAADDDNVRAEILIRLAQLSMGRAAGADRAGDEGALKRFLETARSNLGDAEKHVGSAADETRDERGADRQAEFGARIRLLRAQIASIEGRDEDAQAIVEAATDQPAIAAQFIMNQIGRLGRSGEVEESAQAVENVLSQHVTDRTVLNAAAQYYAVAARVNTQRGEVEDDDRDRWLKLAEHAEGRMVELAEKLFEENPSSIHDAIRLFDVYISADRKSDARALADKLAREPGMRAIGLGLHGLLLLGEEKPAEAAEKLEEAVIENDREWRVHFWLGRARLAEGDAEAAERALRRAHELQPADATALNMLLEALTQQGKFSQAQTLIAEHLRDRPRDVRLLTRSARLFERTGRLKEALQRWQQIAKAQPDDARAKIEVARLHLRLGQREEGIAQAGKVLSEEPANVEAVRLLVSAHMNNRDHAAAEEVLNDALAADPENTALIEIAESLDQALGRPEEAVARLEDRIKAEPEDPVPHLRLAELYRRQGSFEEAISAYRAALDVRPGLLNAELGIVGVLVARAGAATTPEDRQGFLDQAATKLDELKSKAPDALGLHLAEVNFLVMQGKRDEAKRRLQALSLEFENSTEPARRLAQLYLSEQETDLARKELEQLLEKNARDLAAHLMLARLDAHANRLSDALGHCNEVLRYDPANVEALRITADIEARRNNRYDMLAAYETIVRLRPTDQAALRQLVGALVGQEQFRRAIQVSRDAWQRDPDSDTLFAQYVSVLLEAEREEEAETACKRFLGEHHDNVRALLLLAQAQLAQGNSEEARSSLRRAEDASDDKRAFLAAAVQACAARQHYEEAVRLARRLQQANPDDLGARSLLVAVLRDAGETGAAAEVAVNTLEAHPDVLPILNAAIQTLAAADRYDDAIALCKDFLERQPEQVGVRLSLADLQARAGDREASVALLDEIAGENESAIPLELGLQVVQLYMRLNETARAEGLAEALCEAHPDAPQTWLTWSGIYERQGPAARDDAIRVYRRGLDRIPPGNRAHLIMTNNLAYALAGRQHPDDAARQRALDEAVRLAQSAAGDWQTAPTFLIDTLAWIHFQRGDAERASELLDLVVSRPDANAENWFHFAMACARTGRRDDAQRALDKAIELDPEQVAWKEELQAELARNERTM